MDFIKRALEQAYPEMSVEHKKRESKLIITNKKAFVKVEVNQQGTNVSIEGNSDVEVFVNGESQLIKN